MLNVKLRRKHDGRDQIWRDHTGYENFGLWICSFVLIDTRIASPMDTLLINHSIGEHPFERHRSHEARSRCLCDVPASGITGAQQAPLSSKNRRTQG